MSVLSPNYEPPVKVLPSPSHFALTFSFLHMEPSHFAVYCNLRIEMVWALVIIADYKAYASLGIELLIFIFSRFNIINHRPFCVLFCFKKESGKYSIRKVSDIPFCLEIRVTSFQAFETRVNLSLSTVLTKEC